MKIWISLTLGVLLVHLALMQALFPALPVMQTPDNPSFSTRTVSLTKAATALPTQAIAAAAEKAKTKPVRALTPKPAAQTPTESPVVQAENLGAATALADPPTVMVHPKISEAQAVPTQSPDNLKILSRAAPDAARTPEPGGASATQKLIFNSKALPDSVKLVYRVEANKFPFRLGSELNWKHGERSYQAQLSIHAFGQSRVQTSRGQIDPMGLAPDRFSDKSRSEVAAHFNRVQGLVSFSANTPSIALLPGAQDRLSVLIQLAALVASAPQDFSPGTTLRVPTIGPRDGDLWLFTFGNMEALELPGGTQQGLKLVRQPRQLYDQKLEVWLAPGLAYLPARIRITEANGDFVDQKWLSSELADSP
ncbi:MAG: DUF3108 domain-containing protein [Rhodoferax sp.]|nr:DUF3108 domain-containing protein [Rhodoferax sp.]